MKASLSVSKRLLYKKTVCLNKAKESIIFSFWEHAKEVNKEVW